jgi:hypothetical protein
MLPGVSLSDAALSLRKASFGWELLADLLPNVLRPLADPALHPGAFHHGLRLAAIDGVRFNLRNTAAINNRTRKACSGKGAPPAPSPACCAPCRWNWSPTAPSPSPWAGRTKAN